MSRRFPRVVTGNSNRRGAADPNSHMPLPATHPAPKPEAPFLQKLEPSPSQAKLQASLDRRLSTPQSRVSRASSVSLRASTPWATMTAKEEVAPSVARTASKVVQGHTENVMDILRDHFQRRPLQHLIDKFIECDLDNSGDIDEYEFHHAIKSLNLDLSRKDTKALFQLADADGSGALDVDDIRAFNQRRRASSAAAADDARGGLAPLQSPLLSQA